MPRLEYFIVAESYALDSQTNRVSIFNVLEDVKAPHFPAHISLVAIASWNAEPGDQEREFQTSLLIHSIDGPHRFDMAFRMPEPRARTVIQLQYLPVVEAGEMRFEILLDGAHAATHTVRAALDPNGPT